MFKSVRLKKLTSILLIYVLFIQQFIPFAQAIGDLKNPIYFETGSHLILEQKFSKEVKSRGKTDSNYSLKPIRVQTNVDQMTESAKELNLTAMTSGSGGGQGDVSGFTISSTDGMVNKFTGDFSYAIPLMDVEGFPISINYSSNVGMNTEASWVGLGWDLSIGGVSREMRGLPDDFNGEQSINRVHSQRKDETTNGWKAGVVAGYSHYKFKKNDRTLGAQATALIGGYHNSYLGYGTTFDFGVQSKYSIGEKEYFAPKFGLGFSIDTKNGIGKSSSIGLETSYSKKNGNLLTQGANFGSSSNSRVGVQTRSFDLYAGKQKEYGKNLILNSKFGTGTTISYGSITSIPRVMFNEVGISSNFNTSITYGNFIKEKGTYFFGIAGGTYNSENSILSKNMSQPAIGYLHLGKADLYNSIQDGPILDFNRSNEYAYSEEMSNLPFSIQTFDFFHVSGLGISGTFRAFRTDVTDYGDASRKMQMEGGIGEVAVSFQNAPLDQTISLTVEGGISTGDIKSGNETGNWQASFETVNNSASGKFDNQIYFKSVGEPTQNPENLFSTLGGISPSKFKVVSVNSTKYMGLTNNLITNNTPLAINSSAINSLDSKPYSSNVFEPKIASDLTGSEAFYYSKNQNSFINPGQQQFTRVSSIRKGNHLSKLVAISTDGMIFHFGIPTYSIFTDEVLLSTDNSSINNSTGIVQYGIGDNSESNNKGLSNLYDRTTVPAYANSFLLTEMYSSDYIDRTSNGPSNDDIGSYFKFNYTQVYGETNTIQGNYKWRFPMGEEGREAMLNRGFEGTEIDNTAFYTYGEKEVWYNHSIESKNFIAEFYLENRDDAYGVNGDDGVLNTNQPLKRLQKIVLYNKSDRLQNGNSAIPIQTIEFMYDYSLCKNNPANQFTAGANADYSKSGKLTLKSIKITSGNSTELGEQTIDFNYGGANPDFNYSNVDGWGNYKLNSTVKPTDINPYTSQDAATANANSSAWKLTQITNPLNGKTQIEYEADTYAYVQDKRAMNHVDIYKMTNLIQFLYLNSQNTWNGNDYVSNNFTTNLSLLNLASFFSGANLSFGGQQFNTFFNLVFADNSIQGGAKYSSKFGKYVPQLVPNNVIIFPLKEVISGMTKEEAEVKVKNDYFKDENGYLTELFFRTHVKVKTDNGSDLKELIQSIAVISQDEVNPFNNQLPYQDDFKAIGVMPKDPISGSYEYGYVVVDPVNSGSSENKISKKNGEDNSDNGGSLLMHPIQRSAVDYVRQNLPDKVYGSCDGCDTDLSIDWKYFFGGDIYKFMIDKGGYAQSFYNDYSTVKLYDHDFQKYASSSRVKSITYRDEWNLISTENGGVYKWNYFYETRDNSYGVSSFEPLSCKDENPLYTWDRYIDIKKKFPDETKFTTTPNAEALYPSPVIGYSQVDVTFEGIKEYGKTVTSFYTARDFPIQEFKTELGNPEKVKKHNPLTGSSTEKFGFSQGFSVVTNDFHGQIKEIRLLDKGGNTISRSTYTYYGLDEEIPLLDRKGVVTKSKVGFEFDVHSDTRFVEDQSKMWSLGLSFCVTATTKFASPVPSYMFYLLPSFFTTQRTRNFYSSTVVKHINYSARVKSVETQEMMSINTAENLLYDKYTGNVLLSSLKDEFNDKLYSFSYPSHWYYKELRDITGAGSYSAQGTLSQGYFSLNNTSLDLTEYLVQGDLISVSNGTTTTNGYVLTVNPSGAHLINTDGTGFGAMSGGTLTLTLLKTNRNNRLNETMQTVVTKKSISNAVGNFVYPENEILSSSALSYDNRNNIRCTPSTHDKMNNEVLINSTINPFVLGVKGDINVDKQWAWQSERVNDQHAHGIRFDGAYSSYVPYYKLNSTDSRWYTLNESSHPNYVGGTEPYINWRAMGEVNLYDEYGKALESKDQINVLSSVLYGYNSGYQLVPIAQAVNAGQQDIAFDGFEDYSYYSSANFSLSESHFDFKSVLTSSVALDNVEHHSGLSSLKITGQTSATISKKLGSQCENVGDGIVSGMFVAQECLCIKPFEPRPGEYLVSLWVKESGSSLPETYSNAKVTVKIKNGSTVVSTQTFAGSGNIIDGWQRIEGTFTIPENPAAPGTPLNATNIEVSLVNLGTGSVYFDDIRLQPFLAGMTTVVYDPKTLLPMATHDGYNFTTFYNYDENLNSVRVRVETSEGIKTVSESEFGNKD